MARKPNFVFETNMYIFFGGSRDLVGPPESGISLITIMPKITLKSTSYDLTIGVSLVQIIWERSRAPSLLSRWGPSSKGSRLLLFGCDLSLCWCIGPPLEQLWRCPCLPGEYGDYHVSVLGSVWLVAGYWWDSTIQEETDVLGRGPEMVWRVK